MTAKPLSLGVDVGTQGVRCVAIDERGRVQARSSVGLPALRHGGHQEEDPRLWWEAVVKAIGLLGSTSLRDISRLAISCTSGTLCPLDIAGQPTHPAILYSDPRTGFSDQFPHGFAANTIHWCLANRPDLAPALWTSPAGYLAQQLIGAPAPIDASQALKMGYELSTDQWSAKLAVDRATLPDVVDTATAIGRLSSTVAEQLGLSPGVVVLAGVTDGVAGHLATAPKPGLVATSVGSTIVWKTVSNRPIEDYESGVYSHRSPDGTWLPGAASNAGARILSSWFTDAEISALDAASTNISPALIYPCLTIGERFPFVDPSFVPFSTGGLSAQQRFEAVAWAVAAIERRGIEILTAMGVQEITDITTTGGTTAARNWLQLRSDMSGRQIIVPKEASSAFGAAIVASCQEPIELLPRSHEYVQWKLTLSPRQQWRQRLEDYYQVFLDRLTSPTS